jgi:hypothetical protein
LTTCSGTKDRHAELTLDCTASWLATMTEIFSSTTNHPCIASYVVLPLSGNHANVGRDQRN